MPVNAGSCVKLASYLNKELDDDKQFFSHHEDAVTLKEVVEKIDNNKKTLKKIRRNFIRYHITLRQKKSLI